MNWILIVIILVALLLIAMLCRSLVHAILHYYGDFDAKYKTDDQYFDPSISWVNKKVIHWTIKGFIRFKIPVQFSDAFHLFNTIELGCYDMMFTILICLWLGLIWWIGVIIFLIIGIILMPSFFNFGYDKLWR